MLILANLHIEDFLCPRHYYTHFLGDETKASTGSIATVESGLIQVIRLQSLSSSPLCFTT